MITAIAKVFTSGNSQAVRLPKQFRLKVSHVYVTLSGSDLILSPHKPTWDGFFEGFAGLSADFSVAGGLGKDIKRDSFA